MEDDFDIYEGKKFSSLCKDIVKNSAEKKKQLDILISDLKLLIKTVNDAMMVVPLIKEYYTIGVKNDEQLVKLANVVKRIQSKHQGESTGGVLLSDEEKADLRKVIDQAMEKSE